MGTRLRLIEKTKKSLKRFSIFGAKPLSIENLFSYLTTFTDLVPLALFFIFYKKTKFDKGVRMIALWLVFDFIYCICQATVLPLKYDKYFYPVYTLVETILFANFFIVTFRQHSSKKIATVLTIINSFCYLVYYCNTFFILEKPPRIDSIPIGFETLLMIVFLLMYLFEEIKDTATLFVYYKHSFWFAVGIMLYLAGSFFIYGSASLLPLKEVEKYWAFTNLFSMVKNILFAIGIYLFARLDKSKHLLFSYEHLN